MRIWDFSLGSHIFSHPAGQAEDPLKMYAKDNNSLNMNTHGVNALGEPLVYIE
jgi:hypothetical protein